MTLQRERSDNKKKKTALGLERSSASGALTGGKASERDGMCAAMLPHINQTQSTDGVVPGFSGESLLEGNTPARINWG